MKTHSYVTPKQRIDTAEDRIDILEKELEAERRITGQMAEMIFSFASRLSEVEQHQSVLRNIMSRMTQRMEVAECSQKSESKNLSNEKMWSSIGLQTHPFTASDM